MSDRLTLVAFDADDTLWHNERLFHLTHDRFADLLAEHAGKDHLMERLVEAERRNLGHYGYGVKGFVLSMIETALDVTGDSVPPRVIRELIQAGREMLEHPIELLPHAREAVAALSERFTLALVTKGDLLDQERKLAQSGLGELFDAVEIVSEKTPETYRGIFASLGHEPGQAMMVGNSMKSDVVPAIRAGAWGVHVPHELTWALEHDDAPEGHPRFAELQHLGELAELVESVSNGSI